MNSSTTCTNIGVMRKRERTSWRAQVMTAKNNTMSNAIVSRSAKNQKPRPPPTRIQPSFCAIARGTSVAAMLLKNRCFVVSDGSSDGPGAAGTAIAGAGCTGAGCTGGGATGCGFGCSATTTGFAGTGVFRRCSFFGFSTGTAAGARAGAGACVVVVSAAGGGVVFSAIIVVVTAGGVPVSVASVVVVVSCAAIVVVVVSCAAIVVVVATTGAGSS